MPFFLIPGSQGGKKPYPFSQRRVREFNDCNLPRGEDDGGRFGRNDDPRCGQNPYGETDPTKADDPAQTLDWNVKGRQRAIFGADLTADPEADKVADLTATETIRDVMNHGEADRQKREVATELGNRWAQRLAEDPSLHSGAGQAAFDAFYDTYQHSIETHASSVGLTAGGEEDSDSNASNAPDPEDKSDYEEYEEQARQEIDDQLYETAREQFESNRDDGLEVMENAVGEVFTQHAAAVAKAREGVMDVGDHPMLPLPEGEEFQKPERAVLTGAKIGEILTKHGIFTADEFDGALDDVNKPSNEIDYLETVNAIFNPSIEEDPAMAAKYEAAREELLQYAPSAYAAHMAARVAKQDETPFTAEERAVHDREVTQGQTSIQKGLQSKYFNNTANASYESFNSWWDENSSDSYDNADYSNIQSFDSWYNDKYGLDPSEWQDYQDRASATHEQLGENGRHIMAASWLVSQWADSSGDGQPIWVTLQMAAEQEFGLGETYNKVFQTRGGTDVMGTVNRNLATHGPVVRHFLRGMYDNTQEWLDANVKGDYITLYRGFSSKENGAEPGMATVDYTEGSVVGVKMQPMSSFSVDFDTSFDSFGHDIIVTRIPKRQIIGTAMSGYGCLSESEVVVLGGTAGRTVRGFFVHKNAFRTDSKSYKKHKAEASWDYTTGLSSSGTPPKRTLAGAKNEREQALILTAQERLTEFLRIHGGAGSRVAVPGPGERL